MSFNVKVLGVCFLRYLLLDSFNIPCVLDEHNVEFLWSLYASKVPVMAPSVFTLEKIAVASSSLNFVNF